MGGAGRGANGEGGRPAVKCAIKDIVVHGTHDLRAGGTIGADGEGGGPAINMTIINVIVPGTHDLRARGGCGASPGPVPSC